MTKPASPPGSQRNAMVLAAGLGLRMQPLTAKKPKPLIEVAGKPLIAYAFDRLRQARIRNVVVNVHYLADQIERWAKDQTSTRIFISDERCQLLDTGGGIAHALPQLGTEPFFVINSDSFWLDGPIPALARLEAAWEEAKMDSLLLLSARTRAIGYSGQGDFDVDREGRLRRRPKDGSAPYVYAGCFLIAPRLFAGAPQGKFSINILWDRAASSGRLYGLIHDGLWIHVGSPEAIPLAERAVRGEP
jgi:MurNAc alpha-1-phosphate uridylyltransferase